MALLLTLQMQMCMCDMVRAICSDCKPLAILLPLMWPLLFCMYCRIVLSTTPTGVLKTR